MYVDLSIVILLFSPRNYSDFMLCKLLSDDLEEYIQHSIPVQQKKFENMMKELKIDLKPGTLKSKLRKPVEKFPDTVKCEGICQNDKLLDDLDEFFNSTKRSMPPKCNPVVKSNFATQNSVESNSGSVTPSSSIKISVDESNGDLVFDTNFKPKRDFSQHSLRNEPIASTSNENRFSIREYQTNENQPTFPNNRYGNNFKPVPETVADNSYSPYGATKRKRDEYGNDFIAQPNYSTSKPEHVRDDSNAYLPKNDFKSASEELTIQYNKKYGGGNQSGIQQNDQNASYNTNPSGAIRRSLGGKRTVNNKFVPPYANQDNNSNNSNNANSSNQPETSLSLNGIDMTHPRLKNVDPKMAETISNEIMDQCDRVGKQR